MNKHLYPIGLLSLILLIQPSCSSREDEQFKSIEERITLIDSHAESPDLSEVKDLIQQIDLFLTEFPDTKQAVLLQQQRHSLERLIDQATLQEAKQHYEEAMKVTDSRAARSAYREAIEFLSSDRISQIEQTYPQIATWIAQLKESQAALERMRSLLDQDYSNLSAFNDAVDNQSYLYQNQEGSIPILWRDAVRRRSEYIARGFVIQALRNFQENMAESARSTCQGRYNNFRVTGVDLEQMASPTSDELGLSYECQGTFWVNLVGSIIGWDSGRAKVYIKGRISAKTDQNNRIASVSYDCLDARILETAGDL